MTYYILLPGDKEEYLSDSNVLGDRSFSNFWCGKGLTVLMSIVDKQPELLEHCIIKTDTGKVLTVSQFLNDIDKLKLISR